MRCRSVLGLALATLTAGSLRLGAQTITITAGGEASSIIGTDFDVPVVVDMSQRSDKLGSFSLTVRWNPAVLQFISGADGTFGQTSANTDSAAQGVIRVSGANPTGVGGVITLGIARFRPLLTDTTTFKITVNDLYAAGTFADLSGSVVVANRPYCPGRGRYGDVAADGTIDSKDALVALMDAVGLNVSQYDVGLADVDGDGQVTPRDALIILSYGIGLDVSAFDVNTIAPGSMCAVTGLPGLLLDPGNVTMLAGQQVRYHLLATDTAGASLAVAGVRWTSSAPAVATVDSSGKVQAVAAGSATITVFRDSLTAGTATVTVVNRRTVHWVDAAALNATNQIGSSALPFGTIAQAMALVQPGDTVRVLPGRYDDSVVINQGVVLQGDTAGSGVRPVIAGAGGYGVQIYGGHRVEIRNIVFDTLYQAIGASGADTLLVRNVDIRSGRSAAFGIYVDSIGALYVQQSRFVGAGRLYSYSDDGIYVATGAGLVVVDSTRLSDYGGSAVYVGQADSVLVQGSWIHNNAGYGVSVSPYDSTQAGSVALLRNRFTENGYGHVYLYAFARADIDHNVMSGVGYDGVGLYGYTGSVVSMHADSIIANNASWIYVSDADSVFVDSVSVQSTSQSGYYYYGYVWGTRVAVIRDSRFADLSGYAIETDPSGVLPTTQLVVRNVIFNGPDRATCNQCGYGIYTYNTNLDADSVSAQNLDYLLYTYYGSSALRHVMLNHVYYGIQTNCGPFAVDSIAVTDSYYGLEAYGCAATDSALINHATLSSGYEGVYTSTGPTVIQNSVLDGFQYALETYYGPAVIQNVQVTNALSDAIDLYSYGYGNSSVTNSSVSCAPYTYGFGIGLFGDLADTLLARGNTVTGCYDGVGTYGGSYNEIRANAITMPAGGDFGIVGFSDTTTRIVGNTVTGSVTRGAIWSGYNTSTDTATVVTVDSNVVTNTTRIGIQARGAKTLRIQDNQVTNMLAGPCCSGTRNGAIVLLNIGANDQSASVIRNRVTGSSSNGIVLVRSSGDTVTIRVDSNTVKGADSSGIWVDTYAKAAVTHNAIDSTGMDAVHVASLTAPTINQNNFTRSGGYGVNNTSGIVVDATNNWWNDVNGPSGSLGNQLSVGDSVSANVTFSPFLSGPANTPAPAPPPFGTVAQAAPTAASGATRVSGRTAPLRRARPAPSARSVKTPAVPEAPTPLPRLASPEGKAVPQVVQAADARRAAAMAAHLRELKLRLEAHAKQRAEMEAQRKAKAAEQAQRATAARRPTDGGGR